MSTLDGSRRSLLLRESSLIQRSFLDAGWRQGTLFSAPSVCFTLNKLSDLDANEPITQHRRKTKSDEKFVLITQDCDIQALEDREPYVEALLCKHQKQKFLSKIGPNSARRFIIDFDTGLVAEAIYHVPIAKQVLKTLTPEPWPGSPKRLEQFVRWLARRYDRPALPDTIVEAFQKPVEGVLARLDEERPDIRATFSMAVHEVRIKLPASENPPFGIRLVLLIRNDGLSEEEARAIDIFKETVQNTLNPKIVHLDPEVRLLTEEEISMAEYYATRPLFLEYHTYKGEEIEGAEPYDRV